MTDDLVKRLRKRKLRVMSDAYEAIYEACDRIEQLEAALRKIGIMVWEDNKEGALFVVRAALAGEKKDD